MIIINANLHTACGRDVEKGYIRIENGKILDVGEMSSFLGRTDEEIIDCDHMEVYPGFIDAHTHLGMWEDSLTFEGDDGNEDTDPATPQLRAIDAINAMDRGFTEALEAGVVAVATGPGSANPIGGQISVIKTAGKRIDDMILRSPCAIKFALGENPKSVYHGKNQAPVTRMATAAIIRENLLKTVDYIEAKKQAQEDEEKSEYDFKCESLEPLINHEIDAHIHAHRADDIFTALRIGNEFGFSPVIIHCTEGHLIADELLQSGVRCVVGPALCDRSKPELKELTFRTPGILALKGIDVAITTDHPEVQVSLLSLCAALAVKEGMSKEDALKAITINPARILRIDGIMGSIEKGKRAEIVVFDKDPFEYISAYPILVISDGKIRVDKRKQR